MRQRLAILALLLVAPSLAAGQVATNVIVITESRDQDQIVNIAECSGGVTDQLSFNWTGVTSASMTGAYDLLASDQAGCPLPTSGTTTTAHTVTIASSVVQSGLTNYIGVPTLMGQLGITCPGPATAVNFCLFASGTAGSTGSVYGGLYGYGGAAATGSLTLDLQTPPPPVANTPSSGDSSLDVTWSLGTGAADAGTAGAAASYNVYCDVHPQTSPIAKKCGSVTGTGTTSARVTGLQNGVDYDVEVTAVSIGGNESGRSNLVTAAPVQVNDFWRLYRNEGGREQGGCATGAAGVAALIALVPLAFRRRRGRRS